jgi:hypothetical protein
VNRGLVLHYVVPFLFLVSTALGLLAVVLAVNARTHGWESTLEAAGDLFVVSGVLFILTGAGAAVAAFLSLLARPPGLGVLLGCLALSAVGTLLAAGLVGFSEWPYGPALFAVTLLSLFGGWCCWLAFLRGLAVELHRKEEAHGPVDVFWGALRTLAVVLPLVFFGGILLGALVRRPWLVLWVPAGLVGAVAAVAFRLGGFDSLLRFILAPTGFPFALEYLNFIGGVRQLIQRRA